MTVGHAPTSDTARELRAGPSDGVLPSRATIPPMPQPTLLDSHCHLTHDELAADLDGVIERAREAGVAAMVTIGTGVPDGEAAAEVAARFPRVVAFAAGLDPFTAAEAADEGRFDAALAALPGVLARPGAVALGEIGLDYHYDLGTPTEQLARFEPQLEMAVELDLPVVIHVRDAHEDLADALARHPRCRGVIHSFTGVAADAARYLQLGWSVAFNGIVTFRSADPLRAAARTVPIERLLVETDSPYLAPVPVRGRACEPAFVAHTARLLAEVRGEDPQELAARTTANARRLFGWPGDSSPPAGA